MPHALGDQNQIVARPNEGRAEGVAQDVARELVLEVSLDCETDEDVASTARGRATAAAIEDESGLAVAPGQLQRSSSQVAMVARSSV